MTTMLLTTPPPSHPLERSMNAHSAQAPPYSPTLINLNQKYNMSANTLTEALLLLSGMYISLVQPEPGPINIGIHAIFPKTAGTFVDAVLDPFTDRNKYRTLMKYRAIPPTFNISSSCTRSEYAPKEVLEMICEDIFPQNTITIFYVNNHHSIQKYERPAVSYIPKIIESLGLPIISYDTQFSPNARPELSIQLAPTMGQMMDVMFAFLKRFGWTDFSFLCTLSLGCQDEISFIRLKVEESKRKQNISEFGVDMFTYQLLSYVNFTNGRNESEVTEKLLYELHKDSRINLVHGVGSEVKSVMDIAKKLGLTGQDYVWIFTTASITLPREYAIVDESYPLGSFVIGFEHGREVLTNIVKAGIDLWLKALNTVAMSPDHETIDFNTGFSCNRFKENLIQASNDSAKSPLYWKYGHKLYEYFLKSKFQGDLEFDEFGVLKANKFYIMNVQLNPQSNESDSGGRTSDIGDSGGGLHRTGGGYDGQRGTHPSRIPVREDRQDSRPPHFSSGTDSRTSATAGRSTAMPFIRNRNLEQTFPGSNSSRAPFLRDRNSGSQFSRFRSSGPQDKDPDSAAITDEDSEPSNFKSRDPRINIRDHGGRISSNSDRSLSHRDGINSPASNSDNNAFINDSDYSFAFPASSVPSRYEQAQLRQNVGGKFMSEKPSRRSADMTDSSRNRIRDTYNVYDNAGSYNSHVDVRAHHEEEEDLPMTEDHAHAVPRRNRRAVKKQIAKKVADWDGHSLKMYDITWPGGASIPPKGKPEKYVLKVVTWQEDPHVIYREPKADTLGESSCEANSVPCLVYNRDHNLRRTNGTRNMCCTGMCIDLLKRLGEMLNFEVNLTEVAEGSYGSPLNANNTEWNGMLGMLIHKEVDMAIGALSITPERSAAVDFSVPFLQTGITIIVALRHGEISTTAFLEPYDYPSWSLILLFSVHATGASIFIFEWLSPYGLNQGKTSLSVHKFSLFRSFWLIWAMLFGASVSTDQPRGIASRFLANIWALFAVVFCASYTANLAAFMITKDTYYDLSGIQDWRLRNPHHTKPAFKFATIANSSTDLNIFNNHKEIHKYMKNEAQTSVKEAIKNLKKGFIQAFIYDSTTLEYEVGKDDGCKLKTVGKRIAETGYGVAFPKKSPWVKFVDEALLRLQENGDIERLQKHWLARACHNKKETGVSSHTLGILNFTSAFVLLGSGVILGVVILILEHMYFRFGRKSLKKWDKSGCCSLVSLSMGQSLTFEQSVMEAMDYHKHHRCKDPLCETQLWKAKHDLDIALLKISQLRRQIAYSASRDDEKAFASHGSPEVSPHKNVAARRRRQNASDADASRSERSANQPLLSPGGRSETDDDNSPGQSPRHAVTRATPRASFPVSDNMHNSDNYIPLQGFRNSYPEYGSPGRHTTQESDQRKMANTPRNAVSQYDDGIQVIDLDLHPPPPSFDEAMSRYRSSPEDAIVTPSPSPPLPPPPSSPPPPEFPTPTHQSPQEGVSAYSGSNSSPSSGEKRYEPLMLDSPESPSFSSYSDTSGKGLSGRGNLSRLSDEALSSPASQDIDSSLASSPDASKSLNDNNSLPSVGFAGGNLSKPQSKTSTSSTDNKGSSGLQSDARQDTPMAQIKTSEGADNDVNARHSRDSDNIYVNVDDILGKETSF